jgi:hypothetical protein
LLHRGQRFTELVDLRSDSSQPPLTDGGVAASGIGDITTAFFISPAQSTRLSWGAGPVVVLPSTSEPTLGSGKWSACPTIVALKQLGPWTIGALWSQVWSFSGNTTGRTSTRRSAAVPLVSCHPHHHSDGAVGIDRELGGERSEMDRAGQFPNGNSRSQTIC